VITFLTIGYGDVSPHTKGGKALATLLIMMGVFCFTTLLAELNDISQAKRLGADKTLEQRLDELNEVIEQDDDGKVTTEEYIIFNLKKMGKVDDDTISLLRDQFKALDADGSGELDSGDITMLEEAAAHLDREQEARELARERELAAGAGGDGGGGVKMLWPRK
jgi:potassium channel subfamily K